MIVFILLIHQLSFPWKSSPHSRVSSPLQKKRTRSRQKKLRVYDLSTLSATLPDENVPPPQQDAPTAKLKLNCKSRTKLVYNPFQIPHSRWILSRLRLLLCNTIPAGRRRESSWRLSSAIRHSSQTQWPPSCSTSKARSRWSRSRRRKTERRRGLRGRNGSGLQAWNPWRRSNLDWASSTEHSDEISPDGSDAHLFSGELKISSYCAGACEILSF